MLTYHPFVLSEIENGKMKEYMPNPRAYAGAQIERMGYDKRICRRQQNHLPYRLQLLIEDRNH